MKNALANIVALVHGCVSILVLIGVLTVFIPDWKRLVPIAAVCNLLVLSSQIPFKCRCPLTVLERKLRGDSDTYTPFLVTTAKRCFGWSLSPHAITLISDTMFVLPVLTTLLTWGSPAVVR